VPAVGIGGINEEADDLMKMSQIPLLLARLRHEVRAGDPAADTRATVERELDACDAELDRAQPNLIPLRDRLANVAQVLVSAGGIVSAGTGLGAALAALAGWLGRLGQPVQQLLPRPGDR
jgi:hypothetical protein